MANVINRLLVEKLGGRNVDEYVGNAGEVFFDPTTTQLRISDGVTIGGAMLGGAANSSSIKYMFANEDGNVITSNDGITWSDPIPSGMPNIQRMDVYNGVIVYVDNSGGIHYSTSLGTVVLATGTDSQGSGSNLIWNEVEYFPEANLWVAVGREHVTSENSSYNIPALAYSTNGISWTIKQVDDTYRNEFNTDQYNIGWRFSDVTYDSIGNTFVIAVSTGSNDLKGGFFVIDSLQNAILDGNTHVLVDGNFQNVGFFANPFFGGGEFFFATTSDEPTSLWVCENSPSVLENWNGDVYGWLDGGLLENYGYVLQGVAEFTILNSLAVVTTGDGHVWVQPNEPTTNVSIPLPFTSDITDIVRGTTTTITVVGGVGPVNDGEKITISGTSSVDVSEQGTSDQSYNGTYYIKNNNGSFELYTDHACTTPWDTSTYWPIDATGTLTWSHGRYIDSVGIVGQTIYVGNDDEQVFKSTNQGVSWIKVDDQENMGIFLNDFAYGLVNTGGAQNTVTTGDITFENTKIIGAGGGISLVPDTNRYSAGQYVNIYPTVDFDAPHIHMAAGEGGDIFLGDDNSYVQVTHTGVVNLASSNGTTELTMTPPTYQVGTILSPGEQYNGVTALDNEARLTFAQTAPFDQVTVGSTIRFINNTSRVITSIDAIDGFYYFNFDVPVTLNPAYPITITSSDYVAEVPSVIGLRNAGSVWTLGSDGGTIFPYHDSIVRGDNAYNTLTGQTLMFGDRTTTAIITTQNGDRENNSSQRIIINPGKGADGTTGEGGDIYLWAGRGGNAGGTGGDIKIRGGQGMFSGEGGYLRIEGGDSQIGNGGPIELTAGVGGAGNGTVRVRTSDTYNWLFGADGTTSFPNTQITAPVGESITIHSTNYTQMMWENVDQTPGTNKAVVTDFYVEGSAAELDIGFRDGNGDIQTRTWFWAADGSLTLPSGQSSIVFGDSTVQTTAYVPQPVPASHEGQAGDKYGMTASDTTYFYYCCADYTGNGAAIWRRIASDTNWNW